MCLRLRHRSVIFMQILRKRLLNVHIWKSYRNTTLENQYLIILFSFFFILQNNFIRVDHQWCPLLLLTWIQECWTSWWQINGLLLPWLRLLAPHMGLIIEGLLQALQVWECASQAHFICNWIMKNSIRQKRLPKKNEELQKFQIAKTI